MNKWTVVYEGKGKNAWLAGTESWGEVFAIVQTGKDGSIDSADAIFIGFVLDKKDAVSIVNEHNKNV